MCHQYLIIYFNICQTFARADRGAGVWSGSHHHHNPGYRRHQPDGRQQLLHHQRLNFDSTKRLTCVCFSLNLVTSDNGQFYMCTFVRIIRYHIMQDYCEYYTKKNNFQTFIVYLRWLSR